MTRNILRIYDYLHTHKVQCVLSFCIITAILSGLILRLDFKEDISTFLPLDKENQRAMQVYQDVSGASKLFAIFQTKDSTRIEPDECITAINSFSKLLEGIDTLQYITEITTQVDLEKITELTDFVYNNIPYFLTAKDYVRMDSVLSQDNYIESRLLEVKQMLMFPTSGLLFSNLGKDPLNLFTPVVSLLDRNSGDLSYETYDGYIFSKDMSRGIVLMTSRFGNSETKNNSKLMNMLDDIADSINVAYPSIKVHYIGGPAIAVGNATQIKKDSILSVVLSVVLIMVLLIYVFKSLRNIFLIVISIVWGWLFALGSLSIVHDEISLIVIGISSIILGIAVNYPLHLISHCNHTIDIKQTLKEIVTPLVIGNITTVGAFISLIPLKATALRDLGLFSSLLLIGTIIFVIVFLPHVVSQKNIDSKEAHNSIIIEKICSISLENKPLVIWSIAVLTILFGWFSFNTKFDFDMSHINYMTEEQRKDMEYLQQMTTGLTSSQQCLYVVSEDSTIDLALEKSNGIHEKLVDISNNNSNASLNSCLQFFASKKEQHARIAKWNAFIQKHHFKLITEFEKSASLEGFSPEAFSDFKEIINQSYKPQAFDFFKPLQTVFSSNFSFDEKNSSYRVVENLYLDRSDFAKIKSSLQKTCNDQLVFDVQSMNSSLANSLSDDFNYIGWACGLIVFIFLWFSFGCIELAILSFLPMAISWIWILGIMGLTNIQFNIVNIILATFIFGQGDDYTIFMTEGCCFEYAYRRKMVASYKFSIIVSALIMFIGIGTLIFAKHPALRSLAEVTIVGMFSVVLMAYVLPPFVFNWIVKDQKGYRKRPLRLVPILMTAFCGAIWIIQLMTGYIIGVFLFIAGISRNKREIVLHKFVSWIYRIDLRLMPGIKFQLHNPNNESFDQPSVIVCNHQSMLDPIFFMALNPKILIVANQRSSHNPIIKLLFRWSGVYTIKASDFTDWKDCSLERDLDYFRKYIDRGFSIVVFAEGVRNPESAALRCNKEPFYLAERLGVDLVPVFLYGANEIMHVGCPAYYKGKVNMHIERRITPSSKLWGETYIETTKLVHKYFVERYSELKGIYEDAEYYVPLVLDRYRYKGAELMSAVKSNLRKNSNYSAIIDKDIMEDTICIDNCGYGEMSLIMALVHPDKKVVAFDSDKDKLTIARYAADGIADNLSYADSYESYNLDSALKLPTKSPGTSD